MHTLGRDYVAMALSALLTIALDQTLLASHSGSARLAAAGIGGALLGLGVLTFCVRRE